MAKQINPANSNVSKNDSCLFCSNPTEPTRAGGRALGSNDSIILGGGEEESNVLKTLCNHLMPQNQDDIPEQFTPEMFPFCASCKGLVTELWECEEVIRKTQIRMAEITTGIEKKVVEGVILDGQMPSSAATSSEMRFLMLRDVIFKHYRETLQLKRNENERLLSVPQVSTAPDFAPPVFEIATTLATRRLSLPMDDSDGDADGVTGNYRTNTIIPEVFADPLFEEKHHVLKAELQSVLEMEREEDDFENLTSDGENVDKLVTSSSSPPQLLGPFPVSSASGRVKRQRGRDDLSVTKQRKGSTLKSNFVTIRGNRRPQEPEYTKLKDGKVKCGCCNHTFASIYAMDQHLSDKQKRSYSCDVCGKIIVRADHLRTHMYKVHGAGRSEKFSCPQCGSQYSRRYDLKKHLRNRCKGRSDEEIQ